MQEISTLIIFLNIIFNIVSLFIILPRKLGGKYINTTTNLITTEIKQKKSQIIEKREGWRQIQRQRYRLRN